MSNRNELIKNEEHEVIKTPYDGRRALVVGDHPHEGATAECLGACKTALGYAMLFHNPNSEENFFVFDPKEIRWITHSPHKPK